ncbi:hypothetical protein [Arcobacter aquimarinus]|uniref:Uncharacterized protein n=1 Tax=Arcobacter aquimarinus TaxID=1315211 RepID=A0AAE7B6T0_9BACT|nr:hypothetical protein [Arcobacter aquimarinus]QKE26607.1 hypothetical protein AAQM_1871 [Arcobacter aquimarinus]RXI36570.1 hypothetical protein CP986_01685 [Arcobacter aquimarinus]
MFDTKTYVTNVTIDTINNSIITINGEKFKIYLEKLNVKQKIPLTIILAFEPNSNDKVKYIEPYDNYNTGSKKYKRFIFIIACLYISKIVFESKNDKEKVEEAKHSMLSFFNADEINIFSPTIKEFKNFYKSENLTSVSKQVEDIFNTYFPFDNLILFKIIVFAFYHSFDFEIEIDISENFNLLNI